MTEFGEQSAGLSRGGDGSRRRFSWMKLVCIAAVAFVLLVITAWLGTGYYAGGRLQDEIDRIVATGEPLYPRDFDTPGIPADTNSAPLYDRAADQLALTHDERETINNFWGNSGDLVYLNEEGIAGFDEIVRKNAEVLELLRRARALPNADWDIELRTPVINWEFPRLSQYRLLGKLLAVKAIHDHRQGNYFEAVESTRDILAIGRAVEHMPLWMSHLVAIANRELATSVVEQILPEMRIAPGGSLEDDNYHPADRSQLQALRDELLDQAASHESYLRVMQAERMLQLDTVTWVVNGAENASSGGIGVLSRFRVVARPLFEMDALRMLLHMQTYIDVARAEVWTAKAHEIASNSERLAIGDEDSRLAVVSRALSRTFLPSLQRATELHFKGLADRRMAATAIAVRLYKEDHARPPAALDELVGRYLATVPNDPFTEGEPIRYLPDVEKPRLYSVSVNFVDDGGAYTFGKRGRIEWKEKDLPFFLSSVPPRPE
jgi:hypothetical protein